MSDTEKGLKGAVKDDGGYPERPAGQIVISGDDPNAHYSIGEYLRRRVTTLKPPMNHAPNPIKALGLLNKQQWLFFMIAFLAWTWDAFDFFTVSLTVSSLAKQFGKSNSDITWGITLVLMLRSVGAITFGIAADRYGRKWPFIVNNVLFIVLELGTGFCNTYKEFLGVRALFGIAMGGLYGNAAATALEDCPEYARGIISVMLQQVRRSNQALTSKANNEIGIRLRVPARNSLRTRPRQHHVSRMAPTLLVWSRATSSLDHLQILPPGD